MMISIVTPNLMNRDQNLLRNILKLNPNKIIKLIPTTCEWIEKQEALILWIRIPLNSKLLEMASKIEIKDISKIRLLAAESVP